MAADHRLAPGDLWRIAQPAVAMVLSLRHIIDAAKGRLPVFGNLPYLEGSRSSECLSAQEEHTTDVRFG
jgi:hypothetical protein